VALGRGRLSVDDADESPGVFAALPSTVVDIERLSIGGDASPDVDD
jgi:hypothetical protein